MALLPFANAPGSSGGGAPATLEIGSEITDATDGSVLFVGSGAVLAQNNAAFSWDDTGNTLTLAGADAERLIVQGNASQSANLQEWQDSGGTALALISSSGAGTFAGLTNSSGTQNSVLFYGASGALSQDNTNFTWDDSNDTLSLSGANQKRLIVKGNASQSANLQEWQNSAGTALAAIDSSGDIVFGHSASILQNTSDGSDSRSTKIAGGGSASESRGGNIAVYGNEFSNFAGTVILQAGNVGTSGTRDGRIIFNVSNSDVLTMHKTGFIGIGFTTTPSGRVHLTPGSASNKGLIVQAEASQSANLQEWQNSSGTAMTSISATGVISSPGAGASSERFGSGSLAGGASALSLGNGASASASRAIAIGVAVTASASDAIGIGSQITAGHSSIVLGRVAASTAANQFIAGSSTVPMDNVYFGKGVSNSSPTAYAINGTEGSGTNIAGANIVIAGGKATGNAAGGAVLFQTSDAGGSGTTVQTLTTKVQVKVNGDLDLAAGSKNVTVAGANAKKTISVAAAGMWPTTTAGCAALAQVESATNDQNLQVLDFDASTDENAEFTVAMPDNWDGSTVTARFYWITSATSGDVIWAIQGRSYGDAETVDQAYGTAQTVTDTASGTANQVLKSSDTSAMTLAGTPAGGELCQFRVYRDADAVGDTCASDARLVAVILEYGVNAYST